MIKKIFVPLFIFTIFLSVYSANAFIKREPSTRIYGKNVSYTAQVVSDADFLDDIWLSISGTSPNTTVDIKGDFNDGKGDIIVGSGTYTTDANGKLEFSFNHTWNKKDLTVQQKYTAALTIKDPATTLTDSARYEVIVSYAPITLKILNTTTGVVVPNGGTVSVNDQLEFACTNSLNMFLDNTSGTKPAIVTYSGTNYDLKYPAKSYAVGTHDVGCTNIGGAANAKNQSFVVVDKTMTGDLSGTNCVINTGESSCNTTLNWSTTNPVGVSSVTSETDATGASSPNNTIATGNSGTKSVKIPYIVLGNHQGRNFYLYNNGVELKKINVLAECKSTDKWDGSKCVNSLDECITPVGSVRNAYGECVCLSPKTNVNGICADGNLPLTSKFTAFNVSAGYVKKGTSINLSWNIQNPNPSCKIVAESIKGKKLLFDTSNVNFIQHSLHNSLISAPEGKKISVGDYYTAMNKNYLTMNESTRFTASS